MAAPKTGPTAKKRPEDRLGHRTIAEQGKMEQIEGLTEEEIGAITADLGDILQPSPDWHHVALAGWESFCASPLRRFYERTDYVQAWVTCELIHRTIKDGMTAGRAMQLRMYMNDLGFTEGARRTMDIAIQKAAPVDTDKVRSMERARARRASGDL